MVPLNRARNLSRRGALRLLLTPIAGLAAQRWLSGCADDDILVLGADDASADTMAQGQADSGQSTQSKPTSDAGTGSTMPPASETLDAAVADVPWASGGTAAMKGDYPDPFVLPAAATCIITKAMILGPCYADTLEREDISEGVPGVPMRLSLRIVRADSCTPVAGATVDVWHAKAEGVYSEFAAKSMCNPGEQALEDKKFCRGVQTTDEEGIVHFSSVVPGWYMGRAVHVHFTVRVDGDEYLTSQLFFDDALLDEIEQEVDYKARGPRDTPNSKDGILPADDPAPFILQTTKRADGALHAWKVIGLRSSLDEELPSAGGLLPPPDFDGGVPDGFPEGFPGGPMP